MEQSFHEPQPKSEKEIAFGKYPGLMILEHNVDVKNVEIRFQGDEMHVEFDSIDAGHFSYRLRKPEQDDFGCESHFQAMESRNTLIVAELEISKDGETVNVIDEIKTIGNKKMPIIIDCSSKHLAIFPSGISKDDESEDGNLLRNYYIYGYSQYGMNKDGDGFVLMPLPIGDIGISVLAHELGHLMDEDSIARYLELNSKHDKLRSKGGVFKWLLKHLPLKRDLEAVTNKRERNADAVALRMLRSLDKKLKLQSTVLRKQYTSLMFWLSHYEENRQFKSDKDTVALRNPEIYFERYKEIDTKVSEAYDQIYKS